MATGSDLPASINPIVVGDWLRGRLGYDGIAITDSMEMGAIVDSLGWGEAAVAAIAAGVDVVLMPANFRVARQAVLDALANGALSQTRVDEAAARVVRQKLIWSLREAGMP